MRTNCHLVVVKPPSLEGVIALNSTFWLTFIALPGVSLTRQIQRQDQRLQQLIKLIDTK